MGILGGLLGKAIGWGSEKLLGRTKGIDGAVLGQNLGSKLLPFEKGGRVPKRVGMQAGGVVMSPGEFSKMVRQGLPKRSLAPVIRPSVLRPMKKGGKVKAKKAVGRPKKHKK